jgi:hypothetical protein
MGRTLALAPAKVDPEEGTEGADSGDTCGDRHDAEDSDGRTGDAADQQADGQQDGAQRDPRRPARPASHEPDEALLEALIGTHLLPPGWTASIGGRLGIERSVAIRVVAYGLAVGWVIGLFGVGGGFVIVPVLVLGLRFSITEAVATSLLVVIVGSLFALVERIASGDVNWAVAVPFSAAAALGAFAGHAVAERLEGPRGQRPGRLSGADRGWENRFR